MYEAAGPCRDRALLPRPDELDLAAFRTAVARAVVPLQVTAPCPDRFRGRLGAEAVGDVHLVCVDADGHAVHRTPAMASASPQHLLKVSLVEQGSGMIVQDGRETVLRAGDMTLYDTDRPYSLLFDDAVRMSIVMFPRSLLGIPPERLAEVTAVRLDGAAGVGAVVRPCLTALTRQAGQVGQVDTHRGRRLFRAALDLVGALVEEGLAGATAPGAHEALVHRIRDYIDDHLGEPDLSPTRIAAAHFVSVRHLHALFSERGTTVSTVVRTQRLQRCHDDLTNPLLGSRSVTAIGQANGFVDSAHFSRTFRAHFGVPPSALRAGTPEPLSP